MTVFNLTQLEGPALYSLPVEMVERKGIGHPDTICDALAESLSQALSRYYLEHFDVVLHHNVDKALLWGGSARPAFGGGEVTAPMELFLAGRATCEVEGITVPVEELVLETSHDWLRQHLHALDVGQHVKVHSLIRPGSGDLVELYRRQQGQVLANDTSCGVGYAPLDTLEQMVYGVERHLNSPEVKAQHPEFGEDIKVMGVRRGEGFALTVACALIDRHLQNKADYLAAKAELLHMVETEAGRLTELLLEVGVNTADDPSHDSLYLTVTGTSAEAGDDGEVGRGNRVNGLITPYRPMNMEAAAGKNPVTHVGKLYNLAARSIAQRLVAEVEVVQEAYCYLVSQIGAPVEQPQVIDLQLRLADGVNLKQHEGLIRAIAHDVLANLDQLRQQIILGRLLCY